MIKRLRNSMITILSPLGVRGSLFLLLILFFSSCRFEEPNLFSESAAIRMENYLDSTKNLLCSSNNGWVMEYFPTDTTEGYTFLMKFRQSGEVYMAAKNRWINNKYTTDSCLFGLIGDDGPVLTFPVSGSYTLASGAQVGIFHLFSNPEDPRGGSAYDGYGLGGDYEFIVMNTSQNVIRLKGKKRGTTIYLKRLAADQSWPEYFQKIDSIRSMMFDNNTYTLDMLVGTDSFKLKNDLMSYSERAAKFRIYPTGGDQLIDGADYAFIVTPTGIRFHTPFTDNDVSVQTFDLSADKQTLVCTDSAATAYISGQNPSTFFMANNSSWNVDFSRPMGLKFQAIYDSIVQNCKTKLKENFTSLYMRYNGSRRYYTLAFKSGIYTGNFDFSREQTVDNKIKMLFLGTLDVNANYYYNNISGFQSLVNEMSQTFDVTPYCGLNVSLLKFTSEKDPDFSFYVTL